MPTPAGWLPDPSGKHELRYWDGAQWTDSVATGGVHTHDPFVKADPPPPPDQVARERDGRSGDGGDTPGGSRRRLLILAGVAASLLVAVAVLFALLSSGGTDDAVLRGTVETEHVSRSDWSGFGGDPCTPAPGAEIQATESHSRRVISSAQLDPKGTVLGAKDTWTNPDDALCRFRFELPLPSRPEYDIYVESKRDGFWRVTLTSLKRRDFKIPLVSRN